MKSIYSMFLGLFFVIFTQGCATVGMAIDGGKELVTNTLNTAARFIRSRLRTKPESYIAMSWIKKELEAKKRIWDLKITYLNI